MHTDFPKQGRARRSARAATGSSNLYRPVPEPTIKTGVTAMTAAVLELVGRK